MLALLETLEEEGFRGHTLVGGEALTENGSQARTLPHRTYDSAIKMMWTLCYHSSALIDPYGVLPEDPPGTERGVCLTQVLDSFEKMHQATLDQIRRYLILCTRCERFCDGYIARELDSGLLLGALQRLRELRTQM